MPHSGSWGKSAAATPAARTSAASRAPSAYASQDASRVSIPRTYRSVSVRTIIDGLQVTRRARADPPCHGDLARRELRALDRVGEVGGGRLGREADHRAVDVDSDR